MQTDRLTARAGEPFVDAGGVEECFPTVRGRPDHGAAWTLRWHQLRQQDHEPVGKGRAPRTDRCTLDDVTLQRTVTESAEQTMIGYRIDGPPGLHFVHAVHALLDLSDRARIVIDGNPPMQVFDHPVVEQASWPMLDGVDVSYLTPIDQTAYAMIIDCSAVDVIDGPHRLHLDWQVADGSAPTSLLYWRNLGGWPQPAPYRSIGIEPMIGSTADPSADGAGAARLGPEGSLSWRLRLSRDHHPATS
ncbi:MAG TPA: hypothetical protein VIP98_03435 [Microlunatus sp.]